MYSMTTSKLKTDLNALIGLLFPLCHLPFMMMIILDFTSFRQRLEALGIFLSSVFFLSILRPVIWGLIWGFAI